MQVQIYQRDADSYESESRAASRYGTVPKVINAYKYCRTGSKVAETDVDPFLGLI